MLVDRVYALLQAGGLSVTAGERFGTKRHLTLFARTHHISIGLVVRERSQLDARHDEYRLIDAIGGQSHELKHRIHELWYVTDYSLTKDQQIQVQRWPSLKWVLVTRLEQLIADTLDHDQPIEQPVLCHPVWPGREILAPRTAFVLMPFVPDWAPEVYNAIKVAGELERFEVTRADDLRGAVIIHDIWRAIQRTAVVVADITGNNANVFYELGIAHTLGKRTLLLTQGQISNIPFDVTGMRCITYNSTSPSRLTNDIRGYLAALSNIH